MPPGQEPLEPAEPAPSVGDAAGLDLAAVVRDHQAEVWRYLRYLGASPEQADDLTQETFVQMLRGPYRDQGRDARRAWLRTVALNRYRRMLRRDVPEVELEAADAAWLGFARDDGGSAHLAALRLCVDELDGRARTALRLHYEERRSREQIGAAMHLSQDGVKSFMRRLRAALRACVERRIGS